MRRPDLDLTEYKLGSYLFEERVGRGGFADVYLARDLDVARTRARTVAAKVFWSPEDDPQIRSGIIENFQSELGSLHTITGIETIVTYHHSFMESMEVVLTQDTVELTTDDETEDVEVTKKRANKSASGNIVRIAVFVIIMEFADGGSLHRDGSYRGTSAVLVSRLDWGRQFKCATASRAINSASSSS